MSPVTPAQRRATDKYIREKTDELKIRIPKGRKAAIQAAADSKGESLNGYVVQAIDERMNRDKAIEAFIVQPKEDAE